MQMWSVFFLILLSFNTLGDDQAKVLSGYDPVTDIIADNYEAGPFLIYDCDQKHWVCVLESYYKDCQEKRHRDAEHGTFYHSCAPIGKFPTKKSCFQRILFLTTHHHGTRFCIKDEWKTKAVK